MLSNFFDDFDDNEETFQKIKKNPSMKKVRENPKKKTEEEETIRKAIRLKEKERKEALKNILDD